MSAVTGVTLADLFTDLRTYLLAVLPAGYEVAQAQGNRVSFPVPPTAIMTPMGFKLITTNENFYVSSTQKLDMKQSLRWRVQVDLYGNTASTDASSLFQLQRTLYATDLLAGTNIVPLFSSSPLQTTMLTPEMQYGERWTLELNFQVNQHIIVDQQSALTLTIGLDEVSTSTGA